MNGGDRNEQFPVLNHNMHSAFFRPLIDLQSFLSGSHLSKMMLSFYNETRLNSTLLIPELQLEP